jgi:YD repeat-containing protein
MLTQFFSAPPTHRSLYLCFALVLVLSSLAIIPLQPASGAGESVETSALPSAEPPNASSFYEARERRDDHHEARPAAPSTIRLLYGDTRLPLLAFLREDDRSSVSHAAMALRTTAPSFHSYSAAPFTPPTISISSPTNNANFIAGSTITLSANALDSDGTVSKVEFFQGAVKLGEDPTAPYAYDWSNVAAGDYVLTARATDNAAEITTSAAINISVLAQVKQYIGWSSISNGIDLGNGSVRKTSSGAWDFYSGSLQTLLPGDGYFESTAATYNQSINLSGTDGSGRAVVIGSGGWVGIYENNVLVAATSSNPPVPIISAHIAGDRYRIEITNSILRYIRYRSSAREVMFTSTAALPVYPISVGLGMSPQNGEWQKTVLAQLTRKATWLSITNGINLGNGSVKKTSTGVWDFSANAVQTLLRGDGYFESTASMYNQSISLGGSDGAGRALVVGTGGWAAIYENGQEVANTSPIGNIAPHASGDRYRLEIANGSLRYVRYRTGARSVMYTSANSLPAYPLNFGLGASPQNAEWQNTVIAQLSQNVLWSYITNGIDLGNGSVRKTSTGAWDFGAGPKQQLVSGNGYFESTASYWNHSISVGSSSALVVGTGGWAAIYENGAEVANTSPLQNIAPHAVGDRYRLEISRGKLRYVRYRSGARSLMFTSANAVPAYALGYSVGASFQNSEWQNTIFSDNVPEHNDASFVSQTVATTMVPGQTYSVSVTMRNTGASTWTPDGDYQIASENLPDNQRWGLNRVNLSTTVPPGCDATFNFTVTAPATGSHSFQWRMVQQGVERFGTLTTNVTVQTVNNPPTVSLSSPTNNQVFTAGTTVQLAANASDTGGSITKVEFFQGTTKLGEDTTSPYTYNWTNVPAGSYVLTARATDNGGATATSNAVNITVNTPNVPPTVTIAAPTNNATFANDTTITITANAVDSDGIVNKVEFFRGGTTKLGEDTNGTDGFSYSWANVQAGTYSLTVKATDNSGAITTSSGVSITVSLPVVSVASTDADASEPGSNTGIFTVSRTGGTSMSLTVNFSVSGTAVAGTDYTSVGTAVTIPSGAASRTIVITPIDDTAIEGNETATLTLSGNAAYTLGTPASATVTIADNDHYSPIVNITSPAGGATFTTPATITITANASEQAGTIAKVEFFQGATTKLGEDTNGADGFSYTWANVADGSYSLTARATDSYGVAVTSAAVQVNVLNFTVPRLDPMNRTGGAGENPLSRNFNWSVPLVGLPGRAGLDLGLSLSYNSLVWTKSGTNISFDDDRGFPSPGFRLGFPVIQAQYFNSQVGRYAYMLITPNGDRVELRQVNTSTTYEAADSSYLTLTVNTDNTITVRTTDGTQLSYEWKVSDYQCTKIKDRNGNFISINYVAGSGRIDTVVDTLSRTIKFNYDTGSYLSSITQIWNQGSANEQNHEWASFIYNPALPIQTNFSGVTNVGPANSSTLKVLTSVKLNNNSSRFDFAYTSWGQVWKISNYAADGDLLNYRAYNLRGSPLLLTGTESDCPRFTERHDWAENWNGDIDGSPVTTEEVVTLFEQPINASLPDGSLQTVTRAKVVLPDGTYHSIYFAGTVERTAGSAPAWQRGLPLVSDTFGRTDANSPITRQRSAATAWTQDDTNVAYSLNPRVTETNIYDFNASEVVQNRKRTSMTYQSVSFANGTTCRLPQDVYEYQANATTVLRRTHTDYNLAATYTDLRIIGLVSEKRLYEIDPNTQVETLMSRIGYTYDGQDSIQGTDAPVQHDNTNYNASFFSGRANLRIVTRFDVNTSESTTSTIKYNTAGSVVSSTNASGHTVYISYADAFAANGTTLDAALPVPTLAYPTMVTDPGGFTSNVRYSYDLGRPTWTRTAQPNTTQNLPGPETKFAYDVFGRFERVTNLVNNAYTRYEYSSSQNRVDTYATIQAGMSEAHSFSIVDGHGRGIAKASDHPGSVGGFSGQLVLYDQMGRAIKTSNPTETSGSGTPTQWAATGDDASAGWHYTQQTYDWKGRPLVTTNPDNTTKTASYAGCGCAGGQVVTLTDEGAIVDIDPGLAVNNVTKKRQRKIYSDPLGRTVKTEVLNWDGAGSFGTGGSVYSTTVNTYNARDQVTIARQYQGSEASGIYHEATISYDGYGRLKTKHAPEQSADSNISGSTDHTTWNYNNDDTVQSVTDARGITTTFGYNSRRLLTSITYPSAQNLPTGIPTTADVTYTYDAAGNRTSMSDASGNVVNYVYDSLSRLTSEARQFAGLTGTYTLAYEYTLAGQVKTVTDQSPGAGTSFSYTTDNIGRLASIDSTGLGATSPLASNAQYRASGALKHREYGNGTGMNLAYNSRGMIAQYSLSGVKEYNGVARAEGSDYQYHADGRVKFASDFYERQFSSMSFHDKSYQYDHTGRLQQAFTAVMANDFLNGTTTQFASTGPYMQTNTYDAWDNLVGREGLYWNEDNTVGEQIYDAHNRNHSWSYDADGRLISMNEPPPDELTFVPAQHTYDAAGRHVKNTQTTSRVIPLPGNPVQTTITTIDAFYDGDGQQVKRVETKQVNSQPPTSGSTYYLRSSVLGGQVVTEYDAQGARQKSYVYGAGALIASSSNGTLSWLYNNPVTGNGVETNQQGSITASTHVDPEGVETGATDPAANQGEPPPPQPLPHAGAYAAYLPHSLGGSGNCSVDGMEIGCGFASSLLEGGAAEQCPDNDCGPRSVTVNITYKDGSRISFTGFAIIPNGNYVWTGDAARAAVFGWNAANLVYGDNFDIMVKASIGAAWLYEQGYGRIDSRNNFAEPQRPRTVIGFEHLWQDLADIISNGTCRSFIADLIGTAQELTGKKAHAFTVEGMLAELAKYPMWGTDGINLIETGGTKSIGYGGWDKVTGKGGIDLGDSSITPATNDEKTILFFRRALARDFLHEIVHTATKAGTLLQATGGYSDVEMAEAIFEITKDPKDNPHAPDNNPPGSHPTTVGGVIYQRALEKYCP